MLLLTTYHHERVNIAPQPSGWEGGGGVWPDVPTGNRVPGVIPSRNGTRDWSANSGDNAQNWTTGCLWPRSSEAVINREVLLAAIGEGFFFFSAPLFFLSLASLRGSQAPPQHPTHHTHSPFFFFWSPFFPPPLYPLASDLYLEKPFFFFVQAVILIFFGGFLFSGPVISFSGLYRTFCPAQSISLGWSGTKSKTKSPS